MLVWADMRQITMSVACLVLLSLCTVSVAGVQARVSECHSLPAPKLVLLWLHWDASVALSVIASCRMLIYCLGYLSVTSPCSVSIGGLAAVWIRAGPQTWLGMAN